MNELEIDGIEFNEVDELNEAANELPAQELITPIVAAELNDETITQEQINEMKMLGMGKPAGISWYRWAAVQKVRLEHDHMINMAAMGMSQRQIAKELDYSEDQVSKVLNAPEVKLKAQQRMEELYGDAKAALKARNMVVIQKFDDILNSPTTKETTIVDIGKYILDHSIGKAQQTIQHSGSILADLIVRTDQLREASKNAPLLTQPKDEIDNLIDAVIPDDLVIGKRGDSSEGQTE